MKRRVLLGLLLLTVSLLMLNIPLFSEEVSESDTNWIHVEEDYEAKPVTKVEKAESELEYMKERVDFYQRVVRSVEREEAELKELRKIRMRDIKGLKK